jgi:hypothetical protein
LTTSFKEWSHNGFRLSIIVDGTELTEYFDSANGGTVVYGSDGVPKKTVFVESQTGKQFSIRISAPASDKQAYQAQPYIDGKAVTN